MARRVLDRNGVPLDARVDVEAVEFVFHSRGGTRGGANARNMDYGVALRLLLERISAKRLTIEGAWVDSDEAKHLGRDLRSILDGEDLRSGPPQQFRVLSARMQVFGRAPDAPYGGSRVKKIRLRVGGVETADQLANVLELEDTSGADGDPAVLTGIESDHLWEAIALADTESSAGAGPQGAFDLVVEDRRVRPETVVAIAARLAGRELGGRMRRAPWRPHAPANSSGERASRSCQRERRRRCRMFLSPARTESGPRAGRSSSRTSSGNGHRGSKRSEMRPQWPASRSITSDSKSVKWAWARERHWRMSSSFAPIATGSYTP